MKQQYEQRHLEPIVIEHSPPVTEPPGDARGILQTIGLRPGVAIAACVVDVMLFGIDTASLETALPFSAVAAAVLGWMTYRLQLDGGDSGNTAMAKGAFIGLITWIPIPITPLVAIPSGLAGLAARITRK